ncbi:MAG: hypothetical protein KTR19_08835 [Hyphomicrobiales bacterium]|nr:hypothetical protein [Hyphomicrobiales bacterium]
MEQFLGGSPLAVALRLIIISIIVGIVLTALGYNPRDLATAIAQLFEAIADLGFDWVESAIQYFLLGAVIVIPIWLILRLFKFVGGTSNGKDG